jgi:glycosyltransferase involved in cell wall biosynthesis
LEFGPEASGSVLEFLKIVSLPKTFYLAANKFCVQNKLLVIGLVWPEPQSSAAGTHLLHLIDLFAKHNWEVHFATAASTSPYSVDLNSKGVFTQEILLNDSSFDTYIQMLNPQAVLFDRFVTEEQFGWRVAENCPNALRLLDTEDLHCLRLARQEAYKQKRDLTPFDLFSDTAKREIASMLRCDLSLIISEFELDLLQNTFGIKRNLLFYLPLLADPITPETQANWPKFEERSDFVFIGNFLHEPNWQTVLYLKQHIWPILSKQIPTASLKIYGAYPPQKALELNKPSERFLVLGRAESAQEVIQNAKVLLAPIPFGAGAKGKLLEAMCYGTPSVTSSIGAESMPGDLPWNGTVTDDDDAFLEAAVHLYQNEDHWRQAQENGMHLVNSRFDQSQFEQSFIDQINYLLQHLESHRATNFIGALLQHHSLQSTKYLAKWIEEKGK